MKIAIIGGGIAGLAAALALHKYGFCDIALYEQAEALEDVGAGIQLGPNAVKILRALDLETRLLALASQPAALEIRNSRNATLIGSMALGAQAVNRWGAPYVQIHRADLITLLAGALDSRLPGIRHMGRAISDTQLRNSGAEIVFSDGTTDHADLLVGADGIRSKLREVLFPASAARFTGQIAWRMMIPRPSGMSLSANSQLWLGPGGHVVLYPLRGGKLLNLVGVAERDDWREESWNRRGTCEDALRDFSGWQRDILQLIRRAPEHYCWGLYDHPPLPDWHQGDAVLIGDAAHPMLPFLAQGAAMALEDALTLAQLLVRAGDNPRSALARFQSLRKSRTARVQAAARANAIHYHQRSAPARHISHGLLALGSRLRPQMLHRQWDWLYGHKISV